MKALVCRNPGPGGVLELAERPAPPGPGPGQVLVEVEAAGVNFPDGLMLREQYQLKPDPPFTPGSEVCGRVLSVGDRVKGLALGDRVMGYCGTGGFAEQVIADASKIALVPDGLEPPNAAGMTVAYSTSWHALRGRAQLTSGDTVLVLGAAGGVGLAAVQIAVDAGATVIAVASSPEKREAASRSGARHAIAADPAVLTEHVRELTAGRGVDIVLDPVGGELAIGAMRALAWQGRYMVVGFATGDIPSVKLNRILLSSSSYIGVLWGQWARLNPNQNRQMLEQIIAATSDGRLVPLVHSVHSMADASEAVDIVMNRSVIGKVVLTTDGWNT